MRISAELRSFHPSLVGWSLKTNGVFCRIKWSKFRAAGHCNSLPFGISAWYGEQVVCAYDSPRNEKQLASYPLGKIKHVRRNVQSPLNPTVACAGRKVDTLSTNPFLTTLDFENIWFRYAYGPANLDRRNDSDFRIYLINSVCYNIHQSDGNNLPLNPW